MVWSSHKFRHMMQNWILIKLSLNFTFIYIYIYIYGRFGDVLNESWVYDGVGLELDQMLMCNYLMKMWPYNLRKKKKKSAMHAIAICKTQK